MSGTRWTPTIRRHRVGPVRKRYPRSDGCAFEVPLPPQRRAALLRWAGTATDAHGAHIAREYACAGAGTDVGDPLPPETRATWVETVPFESVSYGLTAPFHDPGESLDMLQFEPLLRPFERSVLRLRYLDYTDEQVADVLGVHQSTVTRTRETIGSRWRDFSG